MRRRRSSVDEVISAKGGTDWGALLDVCDAVNRDASGAVLAETLRSLTQALINADSSTKLALILSNVVLQNCGERLDAAADAPSTRAWDYALMRLAEGGLVEDEATEQAASLVAARREAWAAALQRDFTVLRAGLESGSAELSILTDAVESAQKADLDGGVVDQRALEPTRALLAAIDVLNAATPRLLELYGEEATAADEELAATCLSLHAQCAALIESFEGAALTAALLAGGAGGWEVETVESGGRR